MTIRQAISITGAAFALATIAPASAAPSRPPDCETYGCGSNSPELYGVPVRGLSVDPRHPNREGVAIVKGSLRVVARKCSVRATKLIVEDGGLMAVGPDGRRCTGEQLEGASFEIRKGTTKGRVLIADVDKVSTWEVDRTTARYVPVYRFTGGGVGVCRLMAWMDPWQVANLPASIPGPSAPLPAVPPVPPGPVPPVPPVPPSPPAPFEGQAWAKPSDHAVLVQGEIYGVDANVTDEGDEWFSVGCAGSAVAKMRLLGYNPRPVGPPVSNRTSSTDQRVATLKMLTAKYRGAPSHTRQGMPLLWVSRAGFHYYGDPRVEDPRLGPIESHWGKDGSLCLSHLRLSTAPGVTFALAINAAAQEDTTRDGIVGTSVPLCTATAPAVLAAPAGFLADAEWVTFTYNHISHAP